MTADLLIHNFEALAAAPGGVPKLRELIFSLAITGKLVPNADSGSSQVVRLIDVGAVNPRNAAPDGTPVGFVPMKLISTDYRTPIQFEPRAWGEVKKAFTHLADGDVAVAKITPCFENGKACCVRGLPSGLGAGTTELHVFRPDGARILPEYALVFLKSPDFVRAGIPRMTGSAGQKRVPADYFANASFPLPPLPEQHCIVAKVDELMALCDALEARQDEARKTQAALTHSALHHLTAAPDPAECSKRWMFIRDNFQALEARPENVAELRKAILQLAVEGKLVPQDADHESAALLLERTNIERLAAVKNGRIDPMKSAYPVGDEELRCDVRPGWALARLIDLVLEIQTGPFGSSLHRSDYQSGGTPVINPASLKDGKIVPIDGMAVGPATMMRLRGFKLNADDIVMARRGEMGRCAIVTEKEEGWLCGTGSLVLRLPRSLWAPYVAMLIGAPEVRRYLEAASVGATMQNLNQSILARMPVGVPPLVEQHRIVAKVDELMKLCDELEAGLKRERADADRLFDAVVARLMEGAA